MPPVRPTRKRSSDFRTPVHDDPYYDLIYDYELIEASFAQQYGIRLRLETEMCWSEFLTLLSGLNGETPLGNVVRIRSETDMEVLKAFTPEQNRIRSDWQRRQAAETLRHFDRESYEKSMQQLSAMFRTMAKIE